MKDGDVLNNDHQEHNLYINEKGSCLPQPPKNYDEVPNFITKSSRRALIISAFRELDDYFDGE